MQWWRNVNAKGQMAETDQDMGNKILSLVKKAHEESENACFLHGALPREGKK